MITTSSAGGTAPHFLSWNTGDTASLIDSLASAVYSLTLTDQNGCNLIDSMEIVTLSSEITYNSSVENNACAYDSTGWVSLTMFGGAGDFSFAWTSGSDSSTATELIQGIYLVTATDSLGCSVTDSFEILDLSDPSVVIALLSPVICNGDSSAAVQATTSGGVGPFSYAWNTGDSTSTLSTIPGGDYIVSIIDSLGCVATDSFEVIDPTPLLLYVDTLIHPLCNGDSNGLIEVSASGGLGIYSFLWSNAVDTTVVNSLVEGSYSVTVTDSLGCMKDTSISMIDPDALSLNLANVLTPLCNGDSNGIITTLTTGGTLPYAYSWNGNPGESFDSTLFAGTYTIIVTDTNGCEDTVWQVISEPSEIGIDLDSIMDVACFNASDGFIAIHGTGGVGNYAYTWNTLETDSVLLGLDTGSYSVQVTDSNGCLAEDTFEISQPDSLFALINSNANSSCYNNILSGELGAIAIGGTAPYTYSWSNGADSTSIVNVGAGYYSVTISDSNGCFAMASDTIVKDTFPIAGFEPLGAHCINDDSISLGGGSPLGGSYFGSHVFNGAFATSSSLSGQFEVYYVYQDANGCADTASSFIQIDSIPIVSFDSLPVACVNIGALPLSYGSPMGGVYFGNGVVGDTFYPTITDTGSFELGYYVTTEGGCSDTAYQAIVVSEYPALTYFEVNALCGNALPVFLTSGIPSGGTHFGEGVTNGMFNPSSTGIGNTVVGYFYEHICGVDTAFDTLNILPFPSIDVDESFGICINDSAYIEANETYHSYLWNRSDTSQTHLVLGADLGIGSTNRQLIVSNEQGCSDSTVFTLVVSDTQQISISDTAICLDQELYLAAPSGGNLTYTWSNGNVSQEILAYDGSLTRPEPRTLGLEVINAEGCISQDSIQISVIDCDTLRPEGYFTVYPNPSNEKFTLELYLAYDQEITAVVYDVSGKILDQQVLALARGKNWVDYTTERFGAGVIIIRFSLDDRVLATRVVIL